jgi:hypothetical protein
MAQLFEECLHKLEAFLEIGVLEEDLVDGVE